MNTNGSVYRYVPMQFPGRPDLHFDVALNPGDRDSLVEDALAGRFYHELLVGLMLDLLEPGDRFIDLGANLGIFSLTAAAAGCRVLAVEANTVVAERLAESRRRNGFDQIEIENKAVSDKAGTVSFLPNKIWGSVLAAGQRPPEAVTVAADTVDALLAARGWPGAKLIKMDVEGSELAAIRGMRSLLTSSDPPAIIYECNAATLRRLGRSRRELIEALDELGYRSYWIQPRGLTPLAASDYMPLFAVDLLAVKGDLPALKRWRLTGPLTADQQLRLLVQAVIGRSREEQNEARQLLDDAPPGFYDDPLAAALRRKLLAGSVPPSHPESQASAARLRVLHVTSWKTPCGIATYSQSLVEHLVAHGIDSDVASINRADTLWMTRSDFRGLLDKAIESAKSADVVHVQHEFNLFAASGNLRQSLKHFRYLMTSLRRIGKPIVVTFHTEPFVLGRNTFRGIPSILRAMVTKRMWKHYVSPVLKSGRVRALVHSKKSRLRMIQSGIRPERIDVLPHAVPDPLGRDLALEKARAKAILRLPDGCVLLSVFGFVSTYKGGAFAAGLLRDLPKHFHLAFIGGAHPDDLEDRAIDASIAASGDAGDRLHITGFASSELRDLYHCATDICLAPYVKGTNLSSSGAITWALSSGRPVVASKIPAFVELNARYHCVALAAPEAANEWVWNILRLQENEDIAAEMVTNALMYSIQFGWGTTAARVADIYRSLIGPQTRGWPAS